MATIYLSPRAATNGVGTQASPYNNWTAAIAGFAAGDRMQVSGGVIRQTVVFPPAKGGLDGLARSRIIGDPNDMFVIDGGDVITGAVPCDGSDSVYLGGTKPQIYKIVRPLSSFPNNNPLHANVLEDGEQLTICVSRALTFDVFSIQKPSYYWTSTNTTVVGGNIQSFSLPSLTDQYTTAQIQNCRVYFTGGANVGFESTISSFNPSTKAINLTNTGVLYQSNGNKDQFALENLLPSLKQGEWGHRDNGDGNATIYFWPRLAPSVTSKMSCGGREIGFSLNGTNNLEMAYFKIRGCSPSAQNLHASFVNTAGSPTDCYFHHFEVTDGFNAGAARGLMFLLNTQNLEMHDFKVLRGQGTFGIRFAGSNGNAALASGWNTSNNGFIHHGEVAFTTSGPIQNYTIRGWVFAFLNLHDAARAAHGNSFNQYQGCYNNLVFAVNLQFSDGYATNQQFDSTWFINCAFASSRAENAGARAAFMQQEPGSKLGDFEGYLGSGFLNCRGVPYGIRLASNNSFRASNANTPQDVWDVLGCIWHGFSGETFAAIGQFDSNINTSNSVTINAGNFAQPVASIYVDAANDDFNYIPGAAVRSMVQPSRQALINSLKPRWPRMPDAWWNLDLFGNTMNWATPPIGPTIDFDANYRTGVTGGGGGGGPIDPPPAFPLVTASSITMRVTVTP